MLLPTFLWFSSAVNAHQFFTEETWDSFKQIFDTYMVEASKVFALFLLHLISNDFVQKINYFAILACNPLFTVDASFSAIYIFILIQG